MKRFLITTADEPTWLNDRPVLFLGEWCRLYSRRERWSAMDAEVLPYHWDDRDKLYADYRYLQGVYERLLAELTVQLNRIHGVDHGVRYWRILIGPWLGYFTQMLFDRWEMIRLAVKTVPIDGCIGLSIPSEQIVPNDMIYFHTLFDSELWNHAVYSRLIAGWTDIPQKIIAWQGQINRPAASGSYRRFKRWAGRQAGRLTGWLARNNEAFFLSTYLPLREDLYLQWRLGQIPKLWGNIPRPFAPPKAAYDQTARQWHLPFAGADDLFGEIVRTLIPEQIPTLYLEGYRELRESVRQLGWPSCPSLIWTSNAYSHDDVFKTWAAEKVEQGSPLVIGQHGGHYGTGKFGFTEEHQLAISDAFLSWGWTEDGARILPTGNLKTSGKTVDWDPQGQALLVEMTMPRYSYHMYAVPVAGQWLDYFSDQCRFVEALPEQVRRQLLVRLHPGDFGWEQKQRWQDRCPGIRLDEGGLPMASLIARSRLYISTYNATTYLESLSLNVPTVIFWNPDHWELRESAKPFFEELEDAGIFHITPESAARHVAAIWNDVSAWWTSPKVQAVRDRFCIRYANRPNDLLNFIESALREVMRTRKADAVAIGDKENRLIV